MSGFVPYSHEGIGTEDYMCPFCVTPWKCNGPHVDWDDLDNYNGALEDAYAQGLSDAAATTEEPIVERCLDLMGCEHDCVTRDAEREAMLRIIELVRAESPSDGAGTGCGAVGHVRIISGGGAGATTTNGRGGAAWLHRHAGVDHLYQDHVHGREVMSVQRWALAHDPTRNGMVLNPDGKFVTYADHARIVQEMEQAHAAALAVVNAVCDRQRDALAGWVKAWEDENEADLVAHWKAAAAQPRTLTDEERSEIHRLIGELAGYASMCWTPSPSTQEFDSTRAAAAVEATVAAIAALIHDGGGR